jgi:ApaG protein
LYSEITKSIRVTVVPAFLDEHSSPEDDKYVWAYEVRIENLGEETVQLINRYWSITNSLGQTQTVRGPGVVGEQPILKPGEYFEYTSGTPLSTPSGLMMGTYQMENNDGKLFDVSIPAFSLDSPHQSMRVN